MMGWDSSLGMMGGGLMSLVGVVWVLAWTVNSVLVGVLLWKLIQKYSK